MDTVGMEKIFVAQENGMCMHGGAPVSDPRILLLNLEDTNQLCSHSGQCDPDIGGLSINGECGPNFAGNKICTGT